MTMGASDDEITDGMGGRRGSSSTGGGRGGDDELIGPREFAEGCAGRCERGNRRQSLFQGRGAAIAPDHDGQGPGVRVAAPGRRAAGRWAREYEWDAAERVRLYFKGRGECFRRRGVGAGNADAERMRV